MALLALILALAFVVPVSVGVLAYRLHWSLFGGPTRWGNAAASRFGRVGGALVIAIPGWAVSLGVGVLLGKLAKKLTHRVDKPVLDWVLKRVPVGSTSEFTKLNNKLTLIGNNPVIELVVAISFIILAFAYRSRWYIPLLALFGAFGAEKLIHRELSKIVHRPKPIAGAGTYPSGGVERILAIDCAVIVLVILLIPMLSRAWRAGLWTGLFTAAVVEAFTRVYLSKHWMTDAVFSLITGGLLALTTIAAVTALAHRSAGQGAPGHRAAARASEPVG
jgi:hypothetical protein